MRSGTSYAEPTWEKSDEGLIDFALFEAKHYIALSGIDVDKIKAQLSDVEIIDAEKEIKLITGLLSEEKITEVIKNLTAEGARIKSRIRLI
jgi:hypothetical protein